MRVSSIRSLQMTKGLIRVLQRRGDDFHVFHEDVAPSNDGDIQSEKIGSLALFQQKWRLISVPASRSRYDLSKPHSSQDELVGECRWIVRTLRQRAGIMVSVDSRLAPIANEIRAQTQEALRNPSDYEWSRH